MAKKLMTEGIPETDSIRELAAFWDTHDVTDLEDQLEEVIETIFEAGYPRFISIPLDVDDVAALQSIARSRGMTSEALLRDWVLEKLASS